MPVHYINKHESLLAKVSGRTGKISDRTHKEHLNWYVRAVEQANDARHSLESLLAGWNPESGGAPDQQKRLRTLKLDWADALASLRNHELFFSGLGGQGGPAVGSAAELIRKSFGHFEGFLRDFRATALLAKAWIWTGLDVETGTLVNAIGDFEGASPVWTCQPILVLDVADHAFALDFGDDREAYVTEFLSWIDWAAVNSQIGSEQVPDEKAMV
jgi:Fe-Mn family superoxide dismutase